MGDGLPRTVCLWNTPGAISRPRLARGFLFQESPEKTPHCLVLLSSGPAVQPEGVGNPVRQFHKSVLIVFVPVSVGRRQGCDGLVRPRSLPASLVNESRILVSASTSRPAGAFLLLRPSEGRSQPFF